MASHRNRSGFTLVELLVVIVIMAMLVGLLIPAMGTSKYAARRATCLNNQKNIALALLNYESAHRQFPGYVNRIARDSQGNQILASWVVPLFPYLDRTDLWKEWLKGNPQGAYELLMVCPSDPPEQVKRGDSPLSYVVNCGRPGDKDTAAEGVFHNHDVDADPVLVSLDYVNKHDGETYTLLISENVQAGFWTDSEEANVGMVWLEKPERCSPINQCLDAGDRPQDIQYARPSSHHGRGVVVSFCDGHQEFLRDDIDYQVYQHLMTPDSQAAGVAGTFDPSQL
jgi:prepilin-type N-terminal cleavage/methylation domain-containing protein